MSARYTGGLVYNAPGGWSGQFNGSNQYLQAADNAAFQIGTGDFTLEAWINMATLPSSGNYYVIAGKYSSSANCYFFDIRNTSGTLALEIGGALSTVSGNFAFSAGVWYHVATVRNGATTTLYVNGTSIASGTFSDNAIVSGIPYRIGVIQSTASSTFFGYFNGYISNNRLVKGTAVYTSNFNPPTGALQPITNTSILTCRYQTFVDGSSNAFAITNVNGAVVSTVNPFPTSQLPNPALGGAGNGVYTMSQYAALKAANLWPSFDPFYRNVTLNLHGNAGAVLPFNTDASTNNFQVTQVGDTRPSNLTPFIANGYWSNAFATSAAIRYPYTVLLTSWWTQDFTMEMWVYNNTNAVSGANSLPLQFAHGVYNSTPTYWSFGTNASGQLVFYYYNGSGNSVTSTTAASLGTWNHIAMVYTNSSGNISLYLNGVSVASGTKSGTPQNDNTNTVNIGAVQNTYYNGYISNLRVLNGTALYTTTFTPPTTPLTAITNTQLLTNQSNRFVDNSTNNATPTAIGSVAVNPLQPFTAPTGTSAYGSGLFDGTSDYLTVVSNAAFGYGTGDFTIEGWFYFGTVASDQTIVSNLTSASSVNPHLYLSGASNTVRYYTNSADRITGSAIVANAWYHIAVARSGSSTKLFINGAQSGSTYTDTNNYGTSAPVGIGTYWSGSSPVTSSTFNGYSSNVRFVKGTAVYTGNFTPSTTPLTAITNTSLLTVQTNAPSQNNTFLDSSTNNFPITRIGNTTQGTFAPYNPDWSNYFDGSDYLQVSSTPFDFSGGADFTLEFFMYIPANVSYGFIYQNYSTSPGITGQAINAGSTFVGFENWNGGDQSPTFSLGGTTLAGQWNHIAMVRNGSGTNNMSFYINGIRVQQGTLTSFTAPAQGNTYIGVRNYLGLKNYLTGYISNLRIVKGTGAALYAGATITVPTAALTAVPNTVLLICGANRLRDASSNNYSVTRTGDVSVQGFSPFAVAYSTSVIGGSGYFDGSGDNLYVAPASAFAFGTGDFRLGAWIYPLTVSGTQIIIDTRTATSPFPGVVLYLNGTTPSAARDVSNVVLSGGTVAVSQWQYVELTRTSGSWRIFVNGTLTAGPTTSTTNFSDNSPAHVGGREGSTIFFGYISDAIVLKGSGGTTSTVPTAPLTAIANTSLLLNYTNAGIFDNSMMTDWETIGGAQISTSVRKYGSGAISMLATGDYCRGTQPSIVGDINGGDFTIEFWVYFTSVAANRALISKYGNTAENAGGLGYVLQFQQSIPSLRFVLGVGGGTDAVYDFAWSPAASTWYHVAVTRSGSSARAFVNGSQIGSTTTVSTSDVASPNATQIGKTHTVAQYLLGYMDDIRVTRGVARYTTNFTPPTSQVQDQ